MQLSPLTNWHWTIKNENYVWAGITSLKDHSTELNIRWIDSTTIAHELGHILTGSALEADADRKGAEICPHCYASEDAQKMARIRAHW